MTTLWNEVLIDDISYILHDSDFWDIMKHNEKCFKLTGKTYINVAMTIGCLQKKMIGKLENGQQATGRI